MITAKVVQKSRERGGKELTTLEICYPRYIHADFMTHREFCLDGDSILEFDLPSGCNKGKYKRVFTMTLREFADKWHNGDSLNRSLKHRLKNMRIRQLNESTNKIETCTVKDCMISGTKEVFEIQAGNFKVSGSKDHKILTTSGWQKISEIEIEKDYIITEAFGKVEEEQSDEIRFKKIDGIWKSTWLNQIRSEKLDDQNFSCYDCGTELLIAEHDMHHVVPVYEDVSKAFEYNNIIALCTDCHKNRHSTQTWQGGTCLYGRPVKVTSIKSIGNKDTYDLEMNSEYENFIANGVVVHNSRNGQSSRAMPVQKVIEDVINNPVQPIFMRNQKGMRADEYFHLDEAKEIGTEWNYARDNAIAQAKWMEEKGVHKQIANRLLEPFAHIRVIVSSTEWNNFFSLRIAPDAQQEICELAKVMKDVIDLTPSDPLAYSQLHLPYITEDERREYYPNTLMKISVARCARVSYLNHNKEKPIVKDDIILHDRLLESRHMSPFEHVAIPSLGAHANFRNFKSYRRILEQELIAKEVLK